MGARAAEGEVRVAACGPADRAEQARLFNACFKKRMDERGLAWRYDACPHGPSVSFVSRPARGEAVSGYACSPRLVLAHGDERTAACVGETGDVMTHPDWRKRGLFSALDRAAMEAARERGWPFVFGLPNRRSAHIFLELGWREVGRVRPWTFLLRADAAAREARARDGRVQAWLTGVHVRRARATRERARAAAPGLRVEGLARFPDEVTALALAVARRHAWMVRRDAAYLNWRFVDAPSGLHRSVGLRDERGRLVGYVVVQVPRAGEAHGYLVDLLGADEAVERAALEAGLAALESAGASFVEATAIDGSWWQARLAGAGFLAPRAERALAVIVHVHDPAHPLSAAATSPERWYLTDGDRDDETMG